MTREIVTFSDPADVEAALLSEFLGPPPAPETLTAGPTADLRNAMARFSGRATHAARRLRVEEAIKGVSDYPFTGQALRHSAVELTRMPSGHTVEALGDIGFIIPVETVAAALGVPSSDRSAVREDVCTVVKVIGRGDPASATSDLATSRLVARFGDSNNDAVAAISLLYQAHDATAALFASALLADQDQQRRRPALSSTVRTTSDAITIGKHRLQAGTTVVLDLETPRMEFGAGAHGCPGRSIAERMVVGMSQAIRDAGLELNTSAIDIRPDGRPATLPLRIRIRPARPGVLRSCNTPR